MQLTWSHRSTRLTSLLEKKIEPGLMAKIVMFIPYPSRSMTTLPLVYLSTWHSFSSPIQKAWPYEALQQLFRLIRIDHDIERQPGLTFCYGFNSSISLEEICYELTLSWIAISARLLHLLALYRLHPCGEISRNGKENDYAGETNDGAEYRQW